jgi:hypothetical protein
VGLALNSKFDKAANGPENGTAEGELDSGSSLNKGPWRALVLGNNQPNSSILSRPFDYSTGTEEVQNHFNALSSDRENVLEGINFVRNISDILANPWNGVDLIIHIGLNVDLSFTINNIVQNLSMAEQCANNSYLVNSPSRYSVLGKNVDDIAYFEGSRPMSPEMRRYIDLAEEHIRTAFRLHWSATNARPMFANGSHLISSNTFLDVLNAFNVTSWRMLSRELSQFSSKWFFYLLSKVQSEYENLIWTPDISIAPLPSNKIPPMKSTNFYRSGEIGVFQLKLNFVFAQDGFGTRSDGLIPESQFDELRCLLTTSSANGGNSAFSNPIFNETERAMGTLLLILPVPLLSDFGGNQENSATYSCGLR